MPVCSNRFTPSLFSHTSPLNLFGVFQLVNKRDSTCTDGTIQTLLSRPLASSNTLYLFLPPDIYTKHLFLKIFFPFLCLNNSCAFFKNQPRFMTLSQCFFLCANCLFTFVGLPVEYQLSKAGVMFYHYWPLKPHQGTSKNPWKNRIKDKFTPVQNFWNPSIREDFKKLVGKGYYENTLQEFQSTFMPRQTSFNSLCYEHFKVPSPWNVHSQVWKKNESFKEG